jgi:hypothetical protein
MHDENLALTTAQMVDIALEGKIFSDIDGIEI